MKNNMHNAVGFIREEAAKERGPRDGGETCALMNTSAKMLCHFCSSKGEAFWCCLCGEGEFDRVEDRAFHEMQDHTTLSGVHTRFACPWILFKVKGPAGEVMEFDIEIRTDIEPVLGSCSS